MERRRYTCCICHKDFEGWGNNPWPVVNDYDAECCDECNWEKVVPARLKLMNNK